jgi:hypothetical protein
MILTEGKRYILLLSFLSFFLLSAVFLVIQKLDLTSIAIGLFTTTPANDNDVDNAINDNVFADDDNMDDDSSLVVIFDTNVNSEDSNHHQ